MRTVYVLTETKEFNGEYTNPVVIGATTDIDLAARWSRTTSYIHGEIHQARAYDSDIVEALVEVAERTEKEREKKYGE